VKIFKTFKSQKGFSIAEGLVASGIVAVAAMGLGVSMGQMGKTRLKVKAVSSALSIESALQAKLQDASTYSAIADDLSAGSTSTLLSLNIPLEVPIENTVKTPVIVIGQDIYFDRDVNTCTTCVTNNDWLLRLRVDAQKKTGTAFPIYAMAYRIDFNNDSTTLTTIGTQNISGFVSADYKWAIPPEAYVNSSLIPCDPANKEVFITGMNKVTGQAYCIQLAETTSCGTDQVADGWRIVAGKLQIHCKPLNVATISASPYSVQNFNPSTGDTAITGTAVALTESPWPLQTASGFPVPYTGRSVVGPVCPPNYNFVGTCTTVGTTSWPGYTNVGCPAGQTGGPVWSPVSPTGVGAVTNSSSGANVSCALANPVQPTGSGYDAGWDANIQVSGTCVINIPETVPL
jgi:hypothetical protein